MTTPRCGLLFHFTHLDNLADIVAAGELRCDARVSSNNLLTTEAGAPTIKERRRGLAVDCGPGGVVADYVPFYFAARSPMMYKIYSGGVPSFSGSHTDLVYLVTTVSAVVDSTLPYVISDRNAAVTVAEFRDQAEVLGDLTSMSPHSDFIDWPLMKERIWRATDDDPYRMERRMAEFLVHQQVPLDLLVGVGVHSERQKLKCEQVFGKGGYTLEVVPKPDWYYP